jgi:prevent-host-death family protein
VRVLTVAEVERHFAAVLEAVAQGETVVIVRGGRRIAVLSPPSSDHSEAVQDLLNRAMRSPDPPQEPPPPPRPRWGPPPNQGGLTRGPGGRG